MVEHVRLIEKKLLASIEAFPVLYLAGPRQAGKSTLAEKIATLRAPTQYITFDDLQARSAANYDPMAFLEALQGSVVLDEIQLVPELFRPLKIYVDKYRRTPTGAKGKFFLTGSASIMSLPALSDALVGRMVLHYLYPFSVCELSSNFTQTFVDRAFSDSWSYKKLETRNLFDLITQASYPELLQVENKELKYYWCNGYIETILQKDVRAIQEIEKIETIPYLLKLLATRVGGLLNEASLSRDSDINHITVKKYRQLLEGLFLIQSIPAWSTNLGKRLIKSPKIYLGDVNLLLYLINTELEEVYSSNKTLFGQILENFVANELSKQITFSEVFSQLYHYRSASGQEVDFILEGPANRVVGIEVKARSQVTTKDFIQLESLKAELGSRFVRGFVLYLGNEILPFGPDLWALPISDLI